MAGRGSKPGERRGGRQKGTPNRLARETKEHLVEAFYLLGGVKRLVEWASANDTEFYKLWAKTLPMTVASDPNNPVIPKEITIKLV